MKDKIFGVLQRVGRSFMLPIAILPVAGLLLGFGSSFTNETTIATYGLQKILGDGTILHALLIIMNKVGSAVFGHRYGKKRERGSSSFCTDRLLRYERSHQWYAGSKWQDHGRRTDRKKRSGRYRNLCLRHPVLTDGCVRRYYRRPWWCCTA